MKLYKILKDHRTILSRIPGKYAGYAPGLIFGTLDCAMGKLMKKENRVFFHTLADAVREGYRPCRHCKPINEGEFQRIRHLVPEYATLRDFYNRDYACC